MNEKLSIESYEMLMIWGLEKRTEQSIKAQIRLGSDQDSLYVRSGT